MISFQIDLAYPLAKKRSSRIRAWFFFTKDVSGIQLLT